MRKAAALLLLLASLLPALLPADPGRAELILRQPLTPTRAVATALADLDNQNSVDQPFLRYLYSPALDENLALALRLHVNLISREAQLAYPKEVAPGLWRVDLRDYQWSAKVFDNLANIDPYFHRRQQQEVIEVVFRDVEEFYDQQYGYRDAYGQWHDTEVRREKRVVRKRIEKRSVIVKNNLYVPNGATSLAGLTLLTQSQAPIVRADWFLVQSARQISLTNEQTGAGYYDFLELKDRDDYFRLIGQHTNNKNSKVIIRAVVTVSGISAQNRQIEQDGCDNGKHWTTLDTFKQKAQGIAIQTLRAGEFKHDTEEHYAPLPNGLPVTFLCTDQGVRQDSAPDKLGGNRASMNISADTRIHVNISCIQCHQGAVLMAIADDVRPVYTGRLGVVSNDKNVALELRRQYGPGLEIPLNRDREIYQDAFTKTTGQTSQQTMQTYSGAFSKYAFTQVSLEQAAAELGATPANFLKTLKEAAQRQGASDFRLDPFLTQPAKDIQRLTWEDSYSAASDIYYGILPDKQSEVLKSP